MPRKMRRSVKRSKKIARASGSVGARGWAPLLQPLRFTRNCDSGDLNVANGSASAGSSINVANAGLTTLTTSAGGGTSYFGLGLAFELADLPNVTEFTNLFDQYRLHHVDVEIVPLWNVAPTTGTAGGNGNFTGYCHSVLDFDDATAPTAATSGIQSLQQYRSYRLENIVRGRPLRWRLVPMMALGAYSGAFTSYAAQQPMWIDCNSANVQHYGIKFIFELLDPAGVTSYMDFRINLRYYLELRLQR